MSEDYDNLPAELAELIREAAPTVLMDATSATVLRMFHQEVLMPMVKGERLVNVTDAIKVEDGAQVSVWLTRELLRLVKEIKQENVELHSLLNLLGKRVDGDE